MTKEYLLRFTPTVRKIKIPSWDPNLSDHFINKYEGRSWGEFDGKPVAILCQFTEDLPKTKYYRFYFPEDSGFCFADLPSSFFASKTVCKCDLWKNGCSCGQFQLENSQNEFQKVD